MVTRTRVVLAAALLWGTGHAGSEPPRAEACGECHPAALAEWRGSRHAVAASNGVFRASWEHWPNGWCLGCHAPSVEQQVALIGAPAVPGVLRGPLPVPSGDAWQDGVDCAACHVRDDRVLTSETPSDLAHEMHAMEVDPAFGAADLCARCHEFTMQKHTPPWPFAKGETPAQATVSEWRGSVAAANGRDCVDCHMGDQGHGFPGAHTPDLVRDLVRVDVTARSDGHVQATVSAPGAAHRVPTGDPFRRLVLDLCADEGCDDVRASAVLRRVFAPTAESWEEVADRTIPPERAQAPAVRTLDFDLADPVGWWRLTYRYGDPRFEHALPADEVGFVVTRGAVHYEESP